MRFHQLIETAHVGIANAPTRAVELSDTEQTNLTGKPKPYPRDVRLIIRLLPAVYRELDLRIVHGEPNASINIDDAWVRFPEPYEDAGGISVHCRRWMIEMVRDAAMRLGLGMCILFDDGPIYCRIDGDLVIGGRAPSGGLRLQSGSANFPASK